MWAEPFLNREDPIRFDSRRRALSQRRSPPRDFTRSRSRLAICPGLCRETRKKFSNTSAPWQLPSGRCWKGPRWRSGRRSEPRRRRRWSDIAWGMRSDSAPTLFWRREKPEWRKPCEDQGGMDREDEGDCDTGSDRGILETHLALC